MERKRTLESREWWVSLTGLEDIMSMLCSQTSSTRSIVFNSQVIESNINNLWTWSQDIESIVTSSVPHNKSKLQTRNQLSLFKWRDLNQLRAIQVRDREVSLQPLVRQVRLRAILRTLHLYQRGLQASDRVSSSLVNPSQQKRAAGKIEVTVPHHLLLISRDQTLRLKLQNKIRGRSLLFQTSWITLRNLAAWMEVSRYVMRRRGNTLAVDPLIIAKCSSSNQYNRMYLQGPQQLVTLHPLRQQRIITTTITSQDNHHSSLTVALHRVAPSTWQQARSSTLRTLIAYIRLNHRQIMLLRSRHSLAMEHRHWSKVWKTCKKC